MLNRNDRCHCGSGIKYKKCCLTRDEEKTDPYYILEHASEHPLVECLIRKDWEDDGLATILIIRRHLETGKFLFCMFMIDTFCLGLKDVFYNLDMDADDIKKLIDSHPYEMKNNDYQHCRSLILGGIDFAGKFGFEPHSDWEKAKNFIEADKPYSKGHTFGRKGKPFYIDGPFDDVDKIMKILDRASPRQTTIDL